MGFCFWCKLASTALLVFLTSQQQAAQGPVIENDKQASQEVAARMVVMEVPAAYFQQLDRHTRPGVRARVTCGGAILSQKELRQLMEAAQEDKQTSVVQTPTLVAEAGQVASFCSEPLTCQVVPVGVDREQSICLKISGVIQTQRGGDTAGDDGEDEAEDDGVATFRMNTVLPRDGCVLFGGWKSVAEGRHGKETVMLLVAEARVVRP